MSFEQQTNQEQISSTREKLLSLEQEGKYIFHGSPYTIDTLEPRPGRDKNKQSGKMETDGQPAVFGTPSADIAIFRALTNALNGSTAFNLKDGQLYLAADSNILEQIKNVTGKVCILDKEKFHQTEKDYVCEEAITPIEVIEVTYDDLAKDSIVRIKK